jgi:hypothetical protein
MGAVIECRHEEAERLRGYFDVQLRFAETLARRTRRPLSDTCLTFTNLHRRLGLGRTDVAGPSADWSRYASGLEQCASRADRLGWTVAFFADVPSHESATRPFGCFSYELLDQEQVVRIHFSNRDRADGCGPLAQNKADRRRSELAEMFGYIRGRHRDAKSVRGGSWLYNLEAYRRLFPAHYVATVFEPQRVRLGGTSSWGQVLDFRGFVKPAIRQALLANIEVVDIDTPWKAFPLRALGAQSAIEPFYRFYGC